MSAWQTLDVVGISSHWLDWLHGFEPAAETAIAVPILISAPAYAAPLDFRPLFVCLGKQINEKVVLETDFARAELCTGRPARLVLKTNLSDSNPKSVLPITAALAQQWLLAGSLSLHAAVFQFQGKSVLALGQSHSGKSTLIQSALALGARVLSDDFVRVSFPHNRPVAHCLRGFMRFRGADEMPEQVLWLRPSNPQFADTLAIDAVLCLESCDQRAQQTAIQPISKLEASARLINQSGAMFLKREFPIERGKMLIAINRLLDGLPIFSVTTGFDIRLAPEQAFAALFAALWPNQRIGARATRQTN